MAEEKQDGKHYFWELVLSNVIGTAVGYAMAYYATKQNLKLDKYVDKTISFLEGVKKKSQQPEYAPGRKDI